MLTTSGFFIFGSIHAAVYWVLRMQTIEVSLSIQGGPMTTARRSFLPLQVPFCRCLEITLTATLIFCVFITCAGAQSPGKKMGHTVGEAASWTHVVRVGNLILKYRSTSGEAVVEDMGTNKILKTYPSGSFATGWTEILDTPNGILYYNADAGRAAVGRLDSSGSHTTIKEYRNFSRGWTNMVSTPNGILFYNRATGSGAIGRIDVAGDFTTIKSYPPGAFATGWTTIVFTSRGIEYRNDATGATAVGYIDDNGNHVTR